MKSNLYPATVAIFSFLMLSLVSPSFGQSLPESTEVDENKKGWNLALPTLGGKQFWTDYRWWYGWRVQYNGTLDHWRLIDPSGIRRAWGGKQAMLEELETVKKRAPVQDRIEEVVLLVHGLFRTKESMNPIVEQWEAAHGAQPNFRQSESSPAKPLKICIPISYASTRTSIENHAAAFRELAENLPGEPRISFVGHSLGNIVFRRAIGEWQTTGDPRNVLPRLNRAVMLGPPNHGSDFAASLSKLGVFETLTGASGMHLGPAWDKLQSSLGTPPCPFAIVVGDISGSYLSNPLLEGPSDGIVTVEEAQLEGAAETKTFPVLHSFLMSDPEIVKSTLSFLGGGSL
ncbi:MAG: esterase/lipase family protein [Pirellula sp.]|jgi:hypothetical protein